MNWLRNLLGGPPPDSDPPPPTLPPLTPALVADLTPLTPENAASLAPLGDLIIPSFLDSVEAIVFWPDSAGLVFSTTQAVVDWRIGAAEPSRELDWRPYVIFALSPDGSQVALCGGDEQDRDSAPRLWRRADSFFLRNLDRPVIPPDRLAFAPDGQTVAGLSGIDVHLWSVADGSLLEKLPSDDYHDYGDLAYLPDGTLAIADTDCSVLLLQPDGERTLPAPPGVEGAAEALVAAPNGAAVAVIDPQGPIYIWPDLAATAPRVITIALESTRAAAFSPDGALLVALDESSTIRMWETATGTLVHTLTLDYHVSSLAISPDGRLLALGGKVPGESRPARIQFWGVAPSTPQEEPA